MLLWVPQLWQNWSWLWRPESQQHCTESQPSRWSQHGPPKRWYPTTTLHDMAILNMEKVRTSETSVSCRNTTRGHIPKTSTWLRFMVFGKCTVRMYLADWAFRSCCNTRWQKILIEILLSWQPQWPPLIRLKWGSELYKNVVMIRLLFWGWACTQLIRGTP
jgi:hypothetical protein